MFVRRSKSTAIFLMAVYWSQRESFSFQQVAWLSQTARRWCNRHAKKRKLIKSFDVLFGPEVGRQAFVNHQKIFDFNLSWFRAQWKVCTAIIFLFNHNRSSTCFINTCWDSETYSAFHQLFDWRDLLHNNNKWSIEKKSLGLQSNVQ